MPRVKRVLVLLGSLLVVSVVLFMSCGTRLKLSEECTREELFTGQRWKLRLLTTFYGPYREYKPYVTKSVTAFRIEYPSVVRGEEKLLSGVVLIPHEQEKPLPILLYCHGTLFNKGYAPSKWDSAIQLEALPAMNGYITFIPDYLGYGSSNTDIPAYFDQEITVRTILDMLPAGVSYLDDCGMVYQKEMYILGYSQGGHAAVSVLKELTHNNPYDLELKATTSIAAPFKLKENVAHIIEKEVFPATAYVSYLFTSFNTYRWNRDLDDFFRGSSLDLMEQYLAGEITLGKMAANQSDTISKLMNPNFLQDYLGNQELELKQSLERNCDFNFTPVSPLLIVHSEKDEVVPFSTSLVTWKSWISNGADSENVIFHSLKDENHSESADAGILLSLNFFQGYR